ncbi:MAG: tetratricopeptide repeat-containing sensor histidine kinase [Leadbetterella sp.]
MKYFSKVFILISLFLFIGLESNAQQKTVDSLITSFKKKEVADSLLSIKIANHFLVYINTDLTYSRKCLEWLIQSKVYFPHSFDKAVFNQVLGTIYLDNANYLMAMRFTQRAIQLGEKLENQNQKKRVLETAYSNMGLIYADLYDYEEGYQTILKALPYALQGNQSKATGVYNFLSYAQLNLKNYKRAKELVLTGLNYRSKCIDQPVIVFEAVRTLIHINDKINSITYNDFADKIVDSLNKGKMNDRSLRLYNLLKGSIQSGMKNYAKASAYFSKSLEYAKKDMFYPGIAQAHFGLGISLSHLGKLNEAEINLNKALLLAEKYDYYAYIEFLHEIALYYSDKKNFSKAVYYFKKHEETKDKYLQKINANLMQINDGKFQLREKENKITELNQKQKLKEQEHQKRKYWIIGLLTLLALLVISFYAFYRNFSFKRKLAENEIRTLKQEKQLTATESILKGQEEERSRLAKDLHDGLGGVLSSLKYSLTNMTGNQFLTERGSQIFGKSLETLETAIGEMRRVAHNMMPEALIRFGLTEAVQNFCDGINQSGQIQVTFQAYGLEQRLDQTTEITLYRIIQELLNNILKHAEASKALVQITKTAESLNLTIEDNGKGFDINSNKSGIGIKNIQSRVDYLGGSLDFLSQLGTGTSVNIEISLHS